MKTMTTEKRKYRGIEDLYEVEEQLQARQDVVSIEPISSSSRLPESNRLLDSSSLLDSGSLLDSDKDAYQNNSLLNSNSLPDSGSLPIEKIQIEHVEKPLNMMASLPETSGFMKFWHQLTDHLYRQLTPAEQIVHLQLYRLSWGYNKPKCLIGLPKLAERAGVSRSTAQQAVNGLVRKGLIRKVRSVIGSNKEQGTEYAIEPPSRLLESGSLSDSNSLPKSSRQLESTPIKEHIQLKENTHKSRSSESWNKEDSKSKKTEMGVRGNSRFTVEQCLGYADTLQKKGRGITNPGGYATVIFRTGEADEFIEKFLKETELPKAPKRDVSECPDCNGTDYYYPQGLEKGVARCKHKRLVAENE